MSQRTPHDLSLSDDTISEEEDEILYLRKSLFLEILSTWESSSSLSALCDAVAVFKRDLRDSQHDVRIDGSGEEWTNFGKRHLFGEFDQISASQTLERALHYVKRLATSVSEVRTSPINDINLNRWKEYEDIYTDSLWVIDRRDGSGVHTAGYWGNFVPQIPHQMMRRYTRKGDWVLDTFAGSGTTLIEGQRLGRNTIGVELQSRMVEHARQLTAAEANRDDVTIDIICADSTTVDYRALLEKHGRKSVQLIIMHPPYFDIITFSDDPRDLSNAPSAEAFLEMMGRLVDHVAPILDTGRYLVLVVGDKYAKGEWIPLGFQTMHEIVRRGFSLKSIIVKNFEDTSGKRDQKELWRYRALLGGFYVFKHEYIFLLRKR